MNNEGYILTELGRKCGYIGLLKENEIDDFVRSTFTILRGETVPCTAEYIGAITHFSRDCVKVALRKLTRIGLVKELE